MSHRTAIRANDMPRSDGPRKNATSRLLSESPYEFSVEIIIQLKRPVQARTDVFLARIPGVNKRLRCQNVGPGTQDARKPHHVLVPRA